MPKKLTDEEKQLRKWKKDEELLKVIQCNCGQKHEIVARYNGMHCKCGRNLIYMTNINHRNCSVLYTREDIKW